MRATAPRILLAAIACAAGAVAVHQPGTAGAKKGASAAGKYKGLTEYHGTVSFRLTRKGKILGFTLTNATMYCSVVAAPGDPEPPEYEKVVTVTHGPIPINKKSNKNPQGKKFELTDATGYYKGGIVELTSGPTGGRVLDEVGFNGETYFETTSGPPKAPGTELCGTKLIDWEAKRPGSKGFVAVGNSGHQRPPLSEFGAG
jgi:hypothetical protein